MKKFVAILAISMLLTNTKPVSAEIISLGDVLNQSIDHSYTLKTADLQTKIAQQDIRAVKSEYYPTLSAYMTSEYDRDLTGGTSQFTSVGSEIYTNSSQYQNSISLGASYNVFDYGIRGRKLRIAKNDKEKAELILNREKRELKSKVAEAYVQALSHYKELDTKQKVLGLQSELYTINERLNEAGQVSKTNVIEQAVQVAQLMSQINQVKNNYAKALKELEFYTGQLYDAGTLELSDIEEDNFVPVANKVEQADTENPDNPVPSDVIELKAEKLDLNPEQTPEYKIYKLEMDKKQKELEIYKRANLPKFQFDTRYSFYGSDKENLFSAYGDLGQRSLTFRLTSSMPIFDGFKNSAQRAKAKLELERLQVQLDETMSEMKTQYSQTADDLDNANIQMENNEKALELVNTKLEMVDRLNKNGVVDKTSFLKEEASLLNQKFELEQNKLKHFIANYKLNLLNGIDVLEPDTKVIDVSDTKDKETSETDGADKDIELNKDTENTKGKK